MHPSEIVLIVVVVAFAWNLGVHYTGAVMGMPYAARAVAQWPALILIAIFALLGATFASGRVQTTVGEHIISDKMVTVPDATVIIVAAGTLTLLYNIKKIPTSTIQILVFCVVGTGLAAGIPIAWGTIGRLIVVWAIAPVVAFGLGFVLTRLLDLVIPPAASQARAREQIATAAADPLVKDRVSSAAPAARWFPGVARPLAANERSAALAERHRSEAVTLGAIRLLPALLVAVGIGASFVMGANDVSNATGAFIMTHEFSIRVAGLIGGLAIAVGALTWGQRILHTVAFDVVTMDLSMASAAQGVQALVVMAAVTQGFFTSMNQALIGAMAGTGYARGRETVKRGQLTGILRGWLLGPISGLVLSFIIASLVHWSGL